MIPKNWDNVTIENFVGLQQALKDEENDSKFDSLIKKICFLTGKSVEEVKQMDINQISKINKLLKTPLPTQLMTNFKLNGIRYRVILNARELTGERYTAIMNTAKRGTLENLHQIMFLISEPIKWGFRKKFPFVGWKSYEFKPSEVPERIKDFHKLPLKVANPVSVFFSQLSKDLTKAILDYSIQKVDQMNREAQDLIESTDG